MNITIGFDPIIVQWGSFQLGWHGIFTAIAVLVAVQVAVYLGQKKGFSPTPSTRSPVGASSGA